MKSTNALTLKITCAALLAAFGATALWSQSAIPVQNPQGQQGGPAAQPRAPEADRPPVAAPVAAVSEEVTGPGPFFESLMDFQAGHSMAQFGYEAREYFVSGTANGEPYKTRIVIRKPSDDSRFSGLVLAESMHPSGNAWMFHFTSIYTMDAGHIGVDLLTSNPQAFREFNEARYGDLRISNDQVPEVIAQVGAMLKSEQSPLAPLSMRKMVLAGTSASAGVLIRYLPTHMHMRLADMGPIYDGFLPTSTGGNLQRVDVPMIHVPTMTEVHRGNIATRQDGDEPGDQFRVYEFAGMAHIDSRHAVAYYPNPCRMPISRYPLEAYMAVALDHLFKWVDAGVAPPRGDRLWVDRNVGSGGTMMILDEYGNPRGGIRTTYVDVPVLRYGVPNEGAQPPITNAHPFVAVRGEAAQNQLCGLAGYELPLSDEVLASLYRDASDYQAKVAARYDELVRAGWALPVYRDLVLADAGEVRIPSRTTSEN